MSQCPICNAATWIGQRYCSTCDSYLPNPEEEDHFCPQCSIRVGPQQELCHKCNASLAGNGWGIISDDDQGPEAPSLGPRHFHRHRFGHRGPDHGIALHQKSRTSSAGGGAALSTRCRANSCYRAPQGRNSPFGSQAPAAQEPSGLSAPTPPSPPKLTTPTPSPPMYFVNTHSLALRDGPTMSAPQIATLNFKEEVELLDTSGGWGRIREVRRNIVGWSNRRYLVPVTADHP